MRISGKNGSMHLAAAIMCLSGCGIIATVAAQCPSWVKKDQVITGTCAHAPAGWYVYARSDMNGLFKSSLNSFSQQQIPNTQNDRPISIEITYDGQWIVYVNTNNVTIYMIKNDGTQKTQVPVSGASRNFPRSAGFYQNSSGGLEIMYLATNQIARSVPVNFSNGSPQFGTARELVNVSNTQTGLTIYSQIWVTTMHAYHNHFVAQGLDAAGPPPTYQRYYLLFMTIPNNGAGTATVNDIWQFNDLPDTSMYGCGVTLSQDGSKILYNPGSQGDPACIPNRESGLDHKGFVVVPFFETGSPTMGRNEFIDDHGISANWCPVSYRHALHNEIDFTEWLLTRNQRFVVGILTGDLADPPGAWLVEWPTNTWIQLTSGSAPVTDIAAFVQDTSAQLGIQPAIIRQRHNQQKPLETMMYTIQGKKVGTCPAARRDPDLRLSPGMYVRQANGTIRDLVIR